MHYENGIEVAKELVNEVYQLAFSHTRAWTRRDSTDETYVCQAGGMIALKMQAHFDCSPATLKSIIFERQHEWDLTFRALETLEKYDENNQIRLLTCQMPSAEVNVQLCLYVSVIQPGPNEYGIVYQSIDHHAIPSSHPLITVFPSGYFILPVPGLSDKCQLISIFQFPSEFPNNPKVIATLSSSSERIIEGLRGVVNRDKEEGDKWELITDDIRKQLYSTMQDLGPENGWDLKIERPGMRMYTKNLQGGEQMVATRTSFSLPHRSHEIAHQLFEATAHPKWDEFVHVEPSVFVRPNTFFQRMAFADLQEGYERFGYVTCSLNGIKDNVCDMSCRLSFHEPPATTNLLGNAHLPAGGFIVFPRADKPSHSTILGLVHTTYTKACSDEALEREAVRVMYHRNRILGIVSQSLNDKSTLRESTLLRKTPDLSYDECLEKFVDVLIRDAAPATAVDPAPTPVAYDPIRAQQGKRKYLMNVEDVFSTDRSSKAAKPFIFLVSDGSTTPRSIRRRVESPLLGSLFDTLPQEIILEIFTLLDASSLLHIMLTCTHFKDLVSNCNLWKTLFKKTWGDVRGHVARRYCGDDDPKAFFDSFSSWKELYFERQYIESAWEAPDRRALSFTVAKAHSRAVQCTALLSSRHRLVTGSKDKVMRVWDATSGACLFKFNGPSACVSMTAWGDTQVKLGYKDGVIRVYDVMRGECTSETRGGLTMRGCIFSDNSIISWAQNAVHWDETTHQIIGTYDGHLKRVKKCALSKNKSILFTASRDTTVRLWDMHNHTKIGSIEGHTKAVNVVELVDTNVCLTGSSDKLVKAWDLRKLSTPLHTLVGHTGKLKCIKYTEIAKKICTGGDDGVHIWDSSTFKLMRSDCIGDTIVSIAVDEESIAYGGSNGELQYYDFTPHH